MSLSNGSTLHLKCNINSMTAVNLGGFIYPTDRIFVRCYVSAGGGRRIRIDTSEVSPTGEQASWNGLCSVECYGPSEDVQELLDRGSILFELRRRRDIPLVLGRVSRSELVGKAEVPWRDAGGGAPGGTFAASRALVGAEAIHLVVVMSVVVAKASEEVEPRRRLEWKEGCCGCGESCGWSVGEEDMFAAGLDDA